MRARVVVFLAITAVVAAVELSAYSSIRGGLINGSKAALRSWTADLGTEESQLLAGASVVWKSLKGSGILTGAPTSPWEAFLSLVGLLLFGIFGLAIGVIWGIIWLVLLIVFMVVQVGTEVHIFPLLFAPLIGSIAFLGRE